VSTIDVRCVADDGGWRCSVDLGGTRHDVRVARADLARLDPGVADPTELVRRSFAFLLEREPPSSILRSFDLPVIGRYFPEYERTIGRG
jgi:hypothetical protein